MGCYDNDNVGRCCTHLWKTLLNFVHGVSRFLVFVFAFVPCITIGYLVKSNFTSYMNGYPTALSGLMTTWVILRYAIELSICFTVMADTIVATVRPFGLNADGYTFLYLSKIKPSVVRGFLWLLLSGFSSKDLLSVLSSNYNNQTAFVFISIMVDTGRKVLVLPATIWLLISIMRYGKTFFTMEVGIVKRRNSNHWQMTRYYERQSWYWYKHIPKQRIKQRIEKVLLVISPTFALASHCFKFYLDYSIISSTPHTTGFIFPRDVPLYVREIVTRSLYYIDLIVPSVVHVIVSGFLIVYFFILMCKKRFIPVHLMFKVLLFYNLITTVPSETTLKTLVKLSLNQTLSTEIAIWFAACVPLLSLLPVIPYSCTRSIYTFLREIGSIFRSFLHLCLNFIHPSKVYRLFHFLSILSGICGFVLLLWSLTLPWISIDFGLGVNLSALKLLHTRLENITTSIQNVFEDVLGKLSCLPLGDVFNSTATLNQIKSDSKHCFDSIFSFDRKCDAIVSAYKNVTNITTYDNITLCDKSADIGALFSAMHNTGIATAAVPYLGSVGTSIMTGARAFRKVDSLMKKFKKSSKKINKYKTLMKGLGKILKKVTVALNFSLTSEILLIILPCLALGAICISIGFWKRKPIDGVFTRSMIFLTSVTLVVTNVLISFFVWFVVPLLQSVLDVVPLFKITVVENTGWQMVKGAYICSSLSSLLIWIYLTGDFFLRLLTRIFCGCTSCEGNVASCEKYANKDNEDTDITDLDATISEKIEMKSSHEPSTDDIENVHTGINSFTGVDENTDSSESYVVNNPGRDLETDVNSGQDFDNETDYTGSISSRVEQKIKKSLILSKISYPIVWFMPLTTAICSGLLLAYIIFYQPSMYVIQCRLNGKVSSILAKINLTSNQVKEESDNMSAEKTRPDIITAVVTATFTKLFNALTPSIVQNVEDFAPNMTSAFTIPKITTLTGIGHYVFSALPSFACVCYVIGFIITLSPCGSDYTKSLILDPIKHVILVILWTSMSISLTTSLAIARLLESIPLIEVTTEYGLAIQLSLLANFIMLLGWVELNISEYVPVI